LANHREGGRSASSRRLAPRLRARRLNTARLCRPTGAGRRDSSSAAAPPAGGLFPVGRALRRAAVVVGRTPTLWLADAQDGPRYRSADPIVSSGTSPRAVTSVIPSEIPTPRSGLNPADSNRREPLDLAITAIQSVGHIPCSGHDSRAPGRGRPAAETAPSAPTGAGSPVG
jgi:hypothetical protein